jgi:hypothetical protein
MDLQDWQRQIEPALLSRVVNFAQRNGEGGPHASDANNHKHKPTRGQNSEQSSKPYRSGFADLVRFCRNVHEHPPETNKELAPLLRKLADADALPAGVDPDASARSCTRDQCRAVFAAYVTLTFPGLPLAVHECACAVAPVALSAPTPRPGHPSKIQT